MAPGLGPLPPAAGPEPAPGAVDPVANLEPLLATLPRSTVTRIRLGLRALEWLPFPWRFSRSSPAARREFLRRAEVEGSATTRDLLLLCKVLSGFGYASDPRVQAAVGYVASCSVSRRGDRRLPGRARRVAAR